MQDIYVRWLWLQVRSRHGSSGTQTVTATTASGNSASSAAPSLPLPRTPLPFGLRQSQRGDDGKRRRYSAERHHAVRNEEQSPVRQSPGTISRCDHLFQPGAECVAGRSYQGHRQGAAGNWHALSVQGAFQGTAASFQASLSNEPLLILAALVTVYIVLGVLYESFIHPLTILSTLPRPSRCDSGLLICRQELSVVALIGIILLIGIVKRTES